MNINLISPDTDGNRYTVRFKENINIPQNSQIYLNFASLSRESEVVLEEDQTIEIDVRDDTTNAVQMLPQLISSTEVANNPFGAIDDDKKTIKKGKYTYTALMNELSKLLDLQLLNPSAGMGDTRTYRAIKEADFFTNKGVIKNDTDFSLGVLWDEGDLGGLRLSEMTLSATDGRNGGNTNPDSGVVENGVYVKTSATDEGGTPLRKNFDNYGLSNECYFHYGTNDTGTPLANQNVCKFTTSQTFDEMRNTKNCVIIGLYSSNYALGIQGEDGNAPAKDNATRTRGTGATNTGSNYVNPKQSPADYTDNGLRKFNSNFIQIVLDYRTGAEGRFYIQASAKGAQYNQADKLNFWNTINRNINECHTYGGYKANIASFFGQSTDEHARLGFQTYYDKSSPSHFQGRIGKRLYFRVINMAKADVGKSIDDQAENIVLYDSKAHNLYFPEHFFVAENSVVNYTGGASQAIKDNKVASQIPFNVCMTSAVINTGFTDIHIPTIAKTFFDSAPTSIITRYRMKASKELGQYMSFTKVKKEANGSLTPFYTDWLYPNHYNAFNTNLVHIKTMDLDWRNESYSVLINNLPIKNYKNTQKTRDGGFSKAIICNIPAPFSESTDFVSNDKHLTSATYKPNYQIISNLYNQKISLNKFDVEIRRLKDDTPATEILKSIINFTVIPPANYTENINSN
tara:strand:- start:2398 stop:4452 length:2055 start_codon:yes stop_codon:yes gene_type:complete